MMPSHRSSSLVIFTVMSIVLAGCCRFLAPTLIWLPLACALGGIAVLLTRYLTNDVALVRIVAVSFLARTVLSLILFAISIFHLPILVPLHSGTGEWEPSKAGLWLFGGDGVGYHMHALMLLEAWDDGVDSRSAFIKEDGTNYLLYRILSLPVAIVYALTGPSAVHYMLFNSWLGAICALLAYMLALRLGIERRVAFIAATLVAFWPSSLLWSTQLLKDPLVWTLVLFILFLLAEISLRSVSPSTRLNRVLLIAQSVAIFPAIFALTFLRIHTAALLVSSAALVLMIACACRLMTRRWMEALAAVGVIGILFSGVVAGTQVDPLDLFSPRYPEVGYVKRGDRFRQEQRITSARTQYQRALHFNPNYAPAHRGLALLLEEDTKPDQIVQAPAAAKPDQIVQAPTASAVPLRSEPTAQTEKTESTRIRRFQAGFARISSLVSQGRDTINRSISKLSVNEIDARRHDLMSGTSVMGSDVRFRTYGDVIAYVPRAFIHAFLAPFPSALLFRGGQSGVLRPLALPEVVFVAPLLCAFLISVYSGVWRFRAETWVMIVFIITMAVGHGLVIANGGTLFREKLQYLFPALILASETLPAFVYRIVDKIVPSKASI